MFKPYLAAATIALFCVAPAFAEETKMQRTISLTGYGEVQGVPDRATLSLGVFTNAQTAKEALATNSTSMTKLMEALKAAGIADKDMQTSNFMINPRYDYRNDGQQPVANGFDVSNQVTVNVRNIADIGQFLDQSVTAGANQINGISFSFENSDQLMDEARKKAVADAKRKAELYTAASGTSLGSIITISESGVSQPQPIFMAKANAEAASTPISPGEQVLATNITIVWEIK